MDRLIIGFRKTGTVFSFFIIDLLQRVLHNFIEKNLNSSTTKVGEQERRSLQKGLFYKAFFFTLTFAN